MQPHPVVWFEIYVQDMARARAFYEAVFQSKLAPLPAPSDDGTGLQMLAFPMEMGGTGAAGVLCRMDGMAPGGGGTLIDLRCGDGATELGRVEQAGGQVVQPKFSIGEYGFAALVTDTEGNTIGLHSAH